MHYLSAYFRHLRPASYLHDHFALARDGVCSDEEGDIGWSVTLYRANSGKVTDLILCLAVVLSTVPVRYTFYYHMNAPFTLCPR